MWCLLCRCSSYTRGDIRCQESRALYDNDVKWDRLHRVLANHLAIILSEKWICSPLLSDGTLRCAGCSRTREGGTRLKDETGEEDEYWVEA